MATVWAILAEPPEAASSRKTTSQPASKAGPVYTSWPFDPALAARRQDETAKATALAKLAIVELGGHVPMKFILIPAGTFMMGSPRAPRLSAAAHRCLSWGSLFLPSKIVPLARALTDAECAWRWT